MTQVWQPAGLGQAELCFCNCRKRGTPVMTTRPYVGAPAVPCDGFAQGSCAPMVVCWALRCQVLQCFFLAVWQETRRLGLQCWGPMTGLVHTL